MRSSSCRPGQRSAHLPQTPGCVRIIGGSGAAPLATLGEVLASHALQGRRRCQIDDIGGPLLRSQEERPRGSNRQTQKSAALPPEMRIHRAGVQAIGGYLAPAQATRELVGEEN